MNHISEISAFIKDTFTRVGMSQAVMAVSGGIDSAVSLSLTVRALGSKKVFPVLLPFGDQDMTDARTVCDWNQIPTENMTEINIKEAVTVLSQALNVPTTEAIRRGNLMARVRMLAVFDNAKKKQALVVGTENKSEHFLGYFTRFGDEASDIEPIVHLYKTQIRAVAQELNLPDVFLIKKPSAGLWLDQTDETELGFSYDQADKVLTELVDHKLKPEQIVINGVPAEMVKKVCQRVESHTFKLEVPYLLSFPKTI